MYQSKFKKVSFIRLLEKVIQTDVEFVNGVLEKARLTIQKVKSADDGFVEKVLNYEFGKIKSDQFDKIKFELDKHGVSVSERQKAVYITQGLTTNDGIVKMLYSPGFYKVFGKKFKYWKVFKCMVEEILAHEFVHVFQFDKIMAKYKGNPLGYIKTIQSLSQDGINDHKEYLSQKLEIMSFARQAVQEFKSHGFSNEKIIQYLKDFSKAGINDSYTFYVYTYFFDKKDKVLKKFLKYIYDYVK